MPPQRAKPFYESLVEKFRKSYNPDAIKDLCRCVEKIAPFDFFGANHIALVVQWEKIKGQRQ
ncbi:hypothetical protein L1049_010004 [Liquidambar formosana]|uniref:Uncharacterized protein n=1 Tax=Liquidambar formosana TaxID=63359 RepID=A0AAP0N909_LIQFO